MRKKNSKKISLKKNVISKLQLSKIEGGVDRGKVSVGKKCRSLINLCNKIE